MTGLVFVSDWSEHFDRYPLYNLYQRIHFDKVRLWIMSIPMTILDEEFKYSIFMNLNVMALKNQGPLSQ